MSKSFISSHFVCVFKKWHCPCCNFRFAVGLVIVLKFPDWLWFTRSWFDSNLIWIYCSFYFSFIFLVFLHGSFSKLFKMITLFKESFVTRRLVWSCFMYLIHKKELLMRIICSWLGLHWSCLLLRVVWILEIAILIDLMTISWTIDHFYPDKLWPQPIV